MYAVYKYLNGATQANVLADVVAILTGTTDVNTLSASCDKVASSVLTSSTAAGWQMHDASAGTNAVVLKAPVTDDPTKFKYMWLSTNTAGAFSNIFYETWNATTHIGTNWGANDSSFYQRVNYSHTSGGLLYISAATSHCIFHSYSAGGTIGSNYNSGPTGLGEHSRWDPWDTVANGYIPAVSFNYGGFLPSSNQFFYPVRFRGSNGTDMLNTPMMGTTLGTFGNGTFQAPSGNKTIDANGLLMVPLLPIFVTGTFNAGSGWRLGGNMSEKTNMWLLPSSVGNHLDEVTVSGGQTYVIWTLHTAGTGYMNRLAVPKG